MITGMQSTRQERPNFARALSNSKSKPKSPEPKGFPSKLEILRMQSQSPVQDIKTDSKCSNCSRGLLVEGISNIRRDGNLFYCGINCLWCARLDPSGTRHKIARRAKSGKSDKRRHRYNRRDVFHADQKYDDENTNELRNDFINRNDCTNALFEMHMNGYVDQSWMNNRNIVGNS